MARETARKVAYQDRLEHIDVRRNGTGSAQTSNTVTTGATAAGGQTGSLTSIGTFTAGEPAVVLATSATLSLTSGNVGANTTNATIQLNRNGNSLGTGQVTATTQTTSVTTSTFLTTSPERDPTWTASAQVGGANGTATVTFSLSRESRWDT